MAPSTKLIRIILLFNLIGSSLSVKTYPLTSIGSVISLAMRKYETTGIFEVELHGPIGSWFGVAFESHFGGEALIYTTGTDGLATAGQDVDYLVNGDHDGDVTQDTVQNWNVTEISQVNGKQKIVARRAFDTGDASDSVLDYDSNSMTILVAYGTDSLQLAKHGHNSRATSVVNFQDGEDVTSEPTLSPFTAPPTTAQPTNYISPNATQKTFPKTELSGSGIYVALTMDATNDIFEVELYGPIGKWFGFSLGSHTDGDALIYTTGPGGHDTAGQEPDYVLKGKLENVVTKDTQQDWNVLEIAQEDGLQKIVAQRALDTGDSEDNVIDYAVNTMEIMLAQAATDTLTFGDHGHGNCWSATIDFESGTSEITTTTTPSTTIRSTDSTGDIAENVTVKTFPTEEVGYDSGILLGINMYKLEGIFEIELYGPADRWFAIAFGTHHAGDAIIFTSGYDDTDTAGISPDYSLKGQTDSMVQQDTEQNWNVTELSIVDGKQHIVANRLLDTGDADNDYMIDYEANTIDILVAHAESASLQLANHGSYFWSTTLDFVSGTTSESTTTTRTTEAAEDDDDNHGVQIYIGSFSFPFFYGIICLMIVF